MILIKCKQVNREVGSLNPADIICQYSKLMTPLIPVGKMAVRRIKAICKRNIIYIRQVRVKHVELTLGYMEKLFDNGSMTIKFHIMNGYEGLGGHAKDGRCA